MDTVIVLTTVDSAEAARSLARALVEQRLAACVQVDAIESVYRWEGAVRQEPEWRLSCKTTAARHAALREAIMQAHPYAVPEIVTVLPQAVNPPYAAWVAAEVG